MPRAQKRLAGQAGKQVDMRIKGTSANVKSKVGYTRVFSCADRQGMEASKI